MGGSRKRYAYGASYREVIELRDGRQVYLRFVRPSDMQLLRDGFEKLSPYSRYARFMGTKNRLTDGELRYLTRVDGVDHVAIVAIRRSLVSKGEAIGVARFVRLDAMHDTAEPAVVVADELQGKGLGSLLLQRLTEAAWERGIRWFNVELLGENLASRRLFGSLSPESRFQPSGAGTMVVTLPVPEPASPPTDRRTLRMAAVYRLLSHFARTSVSRVRRRAA